MINVVKRHSVLALLALLCVFVLRDLIRDLKVWTSSPDDWMVVHAVKIPDHAVGQDPLILYDRTVFRSFRAEWVVDLYLIDGDAAHAVCDGHGVSEYDPSEKIGEVRLYSWYMGRSCDTVPGRYVAKTVWRTREGVVIQNTSNVFEVSEGA